MERPVNLLGEGGGATVVRQLHVSCLLWARSVWPLRGTPRLRAGAGPSLSHRRAWARQDHHRLRLVTILLAYSVPGGAGGSLVRTAATVLAFSAAGGVWDVDAAEAVAEGA